MKELSESECVQKIIDSSDITKKISEEASWLIAEGSKLFLKGLLIEVAQTIHGANQLEYNNITNITHTQSKYDFLQLMLPQKITYSTFKKIVPPVKPTVIKPQKKTVKYLRKRYRNFKKLAKKIKKLKMMKKKKRQPKARKGLKIDHTATVASKSSKKETKSPVSVARKISVTTAKTRGRPRGGAAARGSRTSSKQQRTLVPHVTAETISPVTIGSNSSLSSDVTTDSRTPPHITTDWSAQQTTSHIQRRRGGKRKQGTKIKETTVTANNEPFFVSTTQRSESPNEPSGSSNIIRVVADVHRSANSDDYIDLSQSINSNTSYNTSNQEDADDIVEIIDSDEN